jgi:hypothetical protein
MHDGWTAMNNDGAGARENGNVENNWDSGGAVDQERGGRGNVVGGEKWRNGSTTMELPWIAMMLGCGSMEVLKILETAVGLSTRNTSVRRISLVAKARRSGSTAVKQPWILMALERGVTEVFNGDSSGAVDQEHEGWKNVVGGKARRSGGTTVEQP